MSKNHIFIWMGISIDKGESVFPRRNILILIALSFLTFSSTHSQVIFNEPISIDSLGSVPSSDALLEMTSTSQGVLIPRLADTNAVTNPSLGLLIFNNADSTFWYFNGVRWLPINAQNTTSTITNVIDTTSDGFTIVKCHTQECPTGVYVNPSSAVVGDLICFGGIVYTVIEGEYDSGDPGTTPDYLFLDKDLGAKEVPTSIRDYKGLGDHYQWGRRPDGHQCLPYGSIAGYADSPTPEVPYVLGSGTDWLLSPNGSLWQGVAGMNNPCPSGWRLPTQTELANESGSWASSNATGAFNSSLKLMGNGRKTNNGISFGGTVVYLWTSTTSGSNSISARINGISTYFDTSNRDMEYCVRCIKDY